MVGDVGGLGGVHGDDCIIGDALLEGIEPGSEAGGFADRYGLHLERGDRLGGSVCGDVLAPGQLGNERPAHICCVSDEPGLVPFGP
ncbi:hypothetical protein GCM10018966_004400 [Streptomyces yanii]